MSTECEMFILQVPVASIEAPLATLGVTRPRRRSRPSVSPERGVTAAGSPSHARRLPRIRRQSTTLDEGMITDKFLF